MISEKQYVWNITQDISGCNKETSWNETVKCFKLFKLIALLKDERAPTKLGRVKRMYTSSRFPKFGLHKLIVIYLSLLKNQLWIHENKQTRIRNVQINFINQSVCYLSEDPEQQFSFRNSYSSDYYGKKILCMLNLC